jgi:hypothetical protein
MPTHFAWNNLSDLGTASASSAAAGWPAANVQTRWVSQAWRSTGKASEWLKVDLGSPLAVTTAILYAHNLSPTATIRLQANSADSWSGTLPVDVLIPYAVNALAHVFTSPQTYQWWRWTLVDPSNPLAYLKVGELFIGSGTTLTKSFQTRSAKPTDRSKKSYAVGGQVSAFILPRFKLLNYGFPFLNAIDKAAVLALFDLVGEVQPLYIIENTADLSVGVYFVEFNGAPTIGFDSKNMPFETMAIDLEELL